MVSGRFKSRRFRKVFVKTPGGKTVIHRRKRKPSKARCAMFGTPLAGVPQKRAAVMRNMPKSKKRPTRPFGGILSSKALRFILRRKARAGFENDEEEVQE
jgi:large subunit ribosomal protein L34e